MHVQRLGGLFTPGVTGPAITNTNPTALYICYALLRTLNRYEYELRCLHFRVARVVAYC